MSRIGKKPIDLPGGVEVSMKANVVTVKGPKGVLTQVLPQDITLKIESNLITVERPTDRPRHRAMHGLSRALVANMIEGVTVGFEKDLEIVGVGYRFTPKGSGFDLAAGFSHPVTIEAPAGIEFVIEGQTNLKVKGIDKQLVGEQAAQIRAHRPPEPYKGKGIRYKGEYVRRKVGKRAQ